MALFDFATVQVYENKDYIEVVFPYDAKFVEYLKEIKGRWNPAKMLDNKEEHSGKSVDEMVEQIEDKLYSIGPNQWRERVQSLKSWMCNKYIWYRCWCWRLKTHSSSRP